jgi:hypothetical protein
MSMNDLSMPAPDMAMSCGMPGDPLNSKGVGGFCDATHTCAGNTICASTFFPGAHFCTIAAPCNCPPGMGCTDTTSCGENTVCVFSDQFSAAGCVPSTCMLPSG